MAAAEATATKRPCRGGGRRSMAGMPTRAAVTGPPRSTPRTASSWSPGISHRGTPPAITPATHTMASSPPNRSSASATAPARASGSVVSATRAIPTGVEPVGGRPRAGRAPGPTPPPACSSVSGAHGVGKPGIVAGPVHRHHRPSGRGQAAHGGRPDSPGRPGHHRNPIHPVTSLVETTAGRVDHPDEVGRRRWPAGDGLRRRSAPVGSPRTPLALIRAHPVARSRGSSVSRGRRSPASARSRLTRPGSMASMTEVSVRPAWRSPDHGGDQADTARPSAARRATALATGTALPPWARPAPPVGSRRWPTGPARPGPSRWRRRRWTGCRQSPGARRLDP